ncbi:hypothetical protein DFQ28_001527 [Apophysomyces sp. BC1034]|nr:hypothetical protein DFQ30_001875 [Apophysomyces sp. BC1015]KAG0166777.1 hypothetical protein DFQ29_000848 [Apophysomyces sp. BC1021]KAG0183573.1 hypothetical protein DFQ28_001527 [Apophysomyces sp. BC1034]
MEPSAELSASSLLNSSTDISLDWIRGIQVGGRKARRQAVEIVPDETIHFYPNDEPKDSNHYIFGYDYRRKINDKRGFLPKDMPLPGTKEFKTEAKAAAEKLNKQLPEDDLSSEFQIPYRSVSCRDTTRKYAD